MSHPILRGLGLRNSEWAWQDLSDQKLRWGCCPSRESHDRFPQSPAPPHGLRYPRHWFHFLLSISVSVFSVRKKTVGFMRLSSVLDSSVDAAIWSPKQLWEVKLSFPFCRWNKWGSEHNWPNISLWKQQSQESNPEMILSVIIWHELAKDSVYQSYTSLLSLGRLSHRGPETQDHCGVKDVVGTFKLLQNLQPSLWPSSPVISTLIQQHLLCAEVWAQCFTLIISLNSHNNHMR